MQEPDPLVDGVQNPVDPLVEEFLKTERPSPIFSCGRSATTIRAILGMAPMLLPARRGVKEK
jgi:hypothetical protein